MQFQIAKVFPASLHFSVGKKNFWVFFSYLLEERPNFFPWLLSRPCSNTSNNIAERSMIWSKLISKHFFPTYSSLFRCWHIISLHLYIFLIMQDEQEHRALYYHCISLQKKLKLVLPDRPLPIIDPNTNYLSNKIFWMEFNLLQNI